MNSDFQRDNCKLTALKRGTPICDYKYGLMEEWPYYCSTHAQNQRVKNNYAFCVCKVKDINLKCKISTLQVCMMQPRVGFQQAKLTRLETELRSLHFQEKLNFNSTSEFWWSDWQDIKQEPNQKILKSLMQQKNGFSHEAVQAKSLCKKMHSSQASWACKTV